MLEKLNLTQNNRSSLLLTIVAFFCCIVISLLQFPLLKEKQNITPDQYIEEQNLKKLQLEFWQKMPSLGFRNLLSNVAYLDFVQYYGDYKAREVTDYDLAPIYFQIAVDNDPRFITAYFVMEPATTLFAGQPQKSVDLITKGLKYIEPTMPFAYQIWTYKGISEVLFLGKIEDAKKSYQMAAEWAKIENTKSSIVAGNIAQQTADFLAKNPDSRLARAGSWMMILGNARDDKTRQIALDNLKKIGAKITITQNRLTVSMPKD